MDNSFGLLDRIAIASFVIGLANYTENVDQTTLQTDLRGFVTEIHAHLNRQDQRLQQIEESIRRLHNE